MVRKKDLRGLSVYVCVPCECYVYIYTNIYIIYILISYIRYKKIHRYMCVCVCKQRLSIYLCINCLYMFIHMPSRLDQNMFVRFCSREQVSSDFRAFFRAFPVSDLELIVRDPISSKLLPCPSCCSPFLLTHPLVSNGKLAAAVPTAFSWASRCTQPSSNQSHIFF